MLKRASAEAIKRLQKQKRLNYFVSFYTMALQAIVCGLRNEEKIKIAVDKYIEKSSDYNLFEKLDTLSFRPTLNLARSSVTIFHTEAGVFEFILVDLMPTCTLNTILCELMQKDIEHGHEFPISSDDASLYYYYEAVLNRIPFTHANQIVNWKRTALQAKSDMLPLRHGIWNKLWSKKYMFFFSYYPAIFTAMLQYQGPITPFLQKVTMFFQSIKPVNGFDTLFKEVVCKPWILHNAYTPNFIMLWHQVMKETAVGYLEPNPKVTEDDVTISSIHFNNNLLKLNIKNTDKCLCLLLILFEKRYRNNLDTILLHEPLPHIFASIFSLYPQLQ